MRASSSGVGARSAYPSSWMRSVVAPTKLATFGDTPRATSWSRYSPNVVQVTSYLMSPCCDRASFFIASVRGPIDQPSPNTSSVTPCFRSLIERPSTMRESVAHDSMLMKPGATASPFASTTRTASDFERSPTAAIRSPRTPTSAFRPGAPVPS